MFLLVMGIVASDFFWNQLSSWLFLFSLFVGCDAFAPLPITPFDRPLVIRRIIARSSQDYKQDANEKTTDLIIRYTAPRDLVTAPRSSATSVFDAKEAENRVGNDLETVKTLTATAIFGCGTEEGLTALSLLNDLCNRRLPFDFDSFHRRRPEASNDECIDYTASPTSNSVSGSNVIDEGERVISLMPKFLPEKSTDEFLESVRIMEDQGWMSTNPDSVDGLPSLHLNLVSEGKPLHVSPLEDEDEFSFGNQIHKLYELVRPFVYDNLLPEADRLLRSNNPMHNSTRKLRVSDVFLRRYGQDVCGSVTRKGISIHYDVYSRITAVVALDEVASKGDNGLFTLELDENTGETSNHKALRRFFPLTTGDCVLHTWDVLHGVDVQAGLDRTSLIVWFDEIEESEKESTIGKAFTEMKERPAPTIDGDEKDDVLISPWLSLEHQGTSSGRTTLYDGNDVRQFVLASALSSASTESERDQAAANRLYLTSASQGNTFALARMGSICEEGALSSSDELQKEAFEILETLRPFDELPDVLRDMLASHRECTPEDYEGCDIAGRTELACRFWLEASLTGNPLAQRSLADEVMFEASRTGDPDQRLLAATLFALAAQQDETDEGPSDSLARVIEYDVAAREVSSREEFLASPVVQTANAALGGL